MSPHAQLFEIERPRLFGIAYRMLGTRADAEDVLQDAFVRFASVEADEIRTPRSLLTTIVTRLCLDQRDSATRRHEQYVGPWLPEPIETDALITQRPADARVDEVESVSMAFLLLLQSLTPLERAVFLLREVFEHSFEESAEILGRTEPACRQLFHRARAHVAEGRPRFAARPETIAALTRSFLEACATGDFETLLRTLASDVVVTSDGGGRARAARKAVHGADACARFLVGTTRRADPRARLDVTRLNGAPAVVVRIDGEAKVAMLLECDDARVRAVQLVLDPLKLRRL